MGQACCCGRGESKDCDAESAVVLKLELPVQVQADVLEEPSSWSEEPLTETTRDAALLCLAETSEAARFEAGHAQAARIAQGPLTAEAVRVVERAPVELAKASTDLTLSECERCAPPATAVDVSGSDASAEIWANTLHEDRPYLGGAGSRGASTATSGVGAVVEGSKFSRTSAWSAEEVAAQLTGQSSTATVAASSGDRSGGRVPTTIEEAALHSGISSSRTNASFMRGSTVRLGGLRTAQYNGQIGVCEFWDSASQRWHVRLATGELRAFKPQNLAVHSYPGRAAETRFERLRRNAAEFGYSDRDIASVILGVPC